MLLALTRFDKPFKEIEAFGFKSSILTLTRSALNPVPVILFLILRVYLKRNFIKKHPLYLDLQSVKRGWPGYPQHELLLYVLPVLLAY